jgi:hypothetical protein
MLGRVVLVVELVGVVLLRVQVRREHGLLVCVLVLSLGEILLLLMLLVQEVLLLLTGVSLHIDVDSVGRVLVQKHILLSELPSLLQLRLVVLGVESRTLERTERVVLLPLRLI